jgi:hypothetical protein
MTRIRLFLSALVVFGAALASPSVNAQIYFGAWDPAYGAPFTAPPQPSALGWRGSAFFSLPGNCGITNQSTTIDNIVDCGGLAQVLSAQVQFYDVAAPLVTIGTINWNSGGPNFTGAIDDMQFVNGILVQLSTAFFDDVLAVFDPTFGYDPGSYEFALKFDINVDVEPGSGVTLYSGPRLFWDDTIEVSGVSNVFAFPPNFTIVPEPTGLALVAGALLAAAGFSRRRRGGSGRR